MPECPICRRSYDGRFQVFVTNHAEPFDRIACARRAAASVASDGTGLAPLALPAIEVVPPVAAGAATPRRGAAALAALAVPPTQAALAAGVGLMAAGTAAAIYLVVQPGTNASPVVAGTHRTPVTSVPHSTKPLVPLRAAIGAATITTATSSGAASPGISRVIRRSSGGSVSSGGSESTPTPSSSAPKHVHASSGSPSAAEAQYGQYEPPFSTS